MGKLNVACCKKLSLSWNPKEESGIGNRSNLESLLESGVGNRGPMEVEVESGIGNRSNLETKVESGIGNRSNLEPKAESGIGVPSCTWNRCPIFDLVSKPAFGPGSGFKELCDILLFKSNYFS